MMLVYLIENNSIITFISRVSTHAREPLYSKFAVVAGWLQSTRAEIGLFFVCTGILKKVCIYKYSTFGSSLH